MKSVVSMFAVASAVHEDRLAQIDAIQAFPGVTWRAAANPRFASEAPGASQRLCGVKDGWKERIALRVKHGQIHRPLLASNVEIPADFDSAEQWPQCAKTIGDIRDQSMCGCCWAFAGAEAASDRMCIATNASLLLPLSAQDVCFCAEDDGCSGGFVEQAFDYIRLHGAVTGSQYQSSGPFGTGMCSDFSLPHCHHHGSTDVDPYPSDCVSQSSPACPAKCDASASEEHANFANDKYSFDGGLASASGEEEIQQMIMAGGPVETAFTVYTDFEDYAGGIYQHVTGEEAGGHAVKMVGWGVENGVKYWKVANSWNPYWGEDGHFRILRGENHGGIEDSVVGSSNSAVWHKGVTPSTACSDQETEDACGSQQCTWCYIKLFDFGICKGPDYDTSDCDNVAGDVTV